MDQVQLLCSLELYHDWYGEEAVPFSVQPVGNTLALVRQRSLVLRYSSNRVEVYTHEPDLQIEALDIQIDSLDSMLYAYTNRGSDRQGVCVADITLLPQLTERLVQPEDWLPAKAVNPCYAKIHVQLSPDLQPIHWRLRFPTIPVHWTYVVDGPHLPERLQIVSKDGTEHYIELESSSASPQQRRPARRFRSPSARSAKRHALSSLQLVAQDATGGPLLSPLPVPAPNALPRPIEGEDALESLIFVTALAKGDI